MSKKNHTLISGRAMGKIASMIGIGSFWAFMVPGLNALAGVPNGTWLSQPQIRYHSSSKTLEAVMQEIKRQQYKLVFLDFRGVSDELQKQVAQEARKQNLIPVVWVQSPQYRSLTIEQLIYEARHGDAIQVDDHFFANYSKRDFQALSFKYNKPIFCSIQPFQKNLISSQECNQLDVQCYTPQTVKRCIALADKLQAVVSLSDKNTFKYKTQLGQRRFNVFLWPYSHKTWSYDNQQLLTSSFAWSDFFSFLPLPRWHEHTVNLPKRTQITNDFIRSFPSLANQTSKSPQFFTSTNTQYE